MLKLDHIALGARDLEKSSETLSNQLGVLPFGGGEHELFGTHNKLWRIETQATQFILSCLASILMQNQNGHVGLGWKRRS